MGVWGHISGMSILLCQEEGLRTKMEIRDVYILGWVVPCEGLGTSDRHWDFRPLAEIGDVNMVGGWGCDRDFWLILSGMNYANLY